VWKTASKFCQITAKERLNFPPVNNYVVDIIAHAIFLLEISALINGKYWKPFTTYGQNQATMRRLPSGQLLDEYFLTR